MICVTVHLHVPIFTIRNYKKNENAKVLFRCMSKTLFHFILHESFFNLWL